MIAPMSTPDIVVRPPQNRSRGLARSAWLADIRRLHEGIDGGPARRIALTLMAPGAHAVTAFRFGHWLLGQPRLVRAVLDPVYHVLDLLVHVLWGIEISRHARVGPGLILGGTHFGGITVSGAAVIGRDCTISQNVTIGMSGQGDRAGVPVVGDCAYIAPGARVFGKIVIGNNVKIGANAVVYKDIPDRAIVVLDPGFRIVSYKGNRLGGNA
jgi:serine O-acetyltransferase